MSTKGSFGVSGEVSEIADHLGRSLVTISEGIKKNEDLEWRDKSFAKTLMPHRGECGQRGKERIPNYRSLTPNPPHKKRINLPRLNKDEVFVYHGSVDIVSMDYIIDIPEHFLGKITVLKTSSRGTNGIANILPAHKCHRTL